MTMKRTIRNVCSMLALVAVAGCSGMQTAIRAPEAPTERVALTPELRRLYRDAAEGSARVEALDGYADLFLRSPGKTAKAYCNVQLHRDGDARLIVTAGLLNWPVADMLIRPDSLFVHDMLNNRMLVGRNNGRNLEKILGVQARFGQLTETLFGIAGIPEPEGAIESVRQGSGKVSYTVRSVGGRKVLVVDEASRALEGLTLLDAMGRKSVEFRFSGFLAQQGAGGEVRVPREIDMALYRPEETDSSHSLRVVYDERVVNPPDLRITFRRPSKAKVVNLDEVERMPWL
ncbi:MAG: DUF4292 domain-containing protein [Chlorobiaceae bacterium]|nr:DUF4292 domain-containing protein [Chlorobiaceae bacterium]